MPVALLPPISSSHGDWSNRQPLTTAPRYARGRGNSRWHRNRSAITYPAGWTVYHWWCGQSGTCGGKYGPLLLADTVPAGDPACGTCEGRALGAGQDPVPPGMPILRFDPRWTTPPTLCPGSGKRDMVEPLDGRLRVGRCLACGVLDAIRAVGCGYDRHGYGLVKHRPGPGLVDPCPFHGWNRITAGKDRVGCACGWPGGGDQ